jgi:Zn finger protein HypA/HybF involved in hydrogenase expression
MHELSITLSIIEGVEEELARHKGAQASAVYLRLGPLSGVVKDALLFSWDVACEGTQLEGSKLEIEEMASGSELEVFALELTDGTAGRSDGQIDDATAPAG